VSYWTEQEFEEQQKSIYPTLFGILIIVYCILVFGRAMVIIGIYNYSTTNMHHQMVEKVIRSKILFFDSNPVGRIFTRFSKDISVLDILLPGVTVFATFGLFRTITVVITLAVIHPLLLIVVALALFLMILILKRALGPLRESQRIDSVYRGPIHSSFTNVVNGLVTLRAFERIPYFRGMFIDQLEKSCNVTFTYFAINRWMAMTFDSVCVMFTLSVASFSLYGKGKIDNDVLAFSL
jgi:ATP-binding cassette, subfamily C (CFTR/MRP), member 4